MSITKKLHRILAISLAAMIILTATACGSSANEANTEISTGTAGGDAQLDTNKFVKLSMYLLGEVPNDYDEMLAELNTRMKNDINAELEVFWLSWGEWEQRYPLILSSGEPFDMIYSASWTNYETEARKGAFYKLNDLLEVYSPQTMAEQPPEAWEEVSIDDGIYMVPMNYIEVTPHGFVVRGDLRKKHNIGEIKTLEDFGDYLGAIKANEPELVPYNAGAFDLNFWTFYMEYVNSWSHKSMNYSFGINNDDPLGQVFKTYETPEYTALIATMRDWYEKGYWSKDVLVNQTASNDALVNGTSGASLMNILQFNEFYLKLQDVHPEWELEWYEMGPDVPKKGGAYTSNGVSINANSKNPERALMLLELLRHNQEYYDLTTYGILGKNYELTTEGKLKLPEGVAAEDNGFPPESACPWGWRQQKFFRSYENAYPKYDELMKGIVDRSVSVSLSSFNFNQDTVKNELANITNVRQQFEMPMLWGVVDPDTGLAEFKAQMTTAGADKYMEELQKQVSAYLANK